MPCTSNVQIFQQAHNSANWTSNILTWIKNNPAIVAGGAARILSVYRKHEKEKEDCMMNMVGLFASLYNDGGGIAPSLPYCNPLTDPYGCTTNNGGSSYTYPLVTPSPQPVSLNPQAPVNTPMDAVVSTQVTTQTNNIPLAVNLPTADPGQLVNVPSSIPVTEQSPNPILIARANPWLVGLALGAGVWYFSKKKKGRRK
jgi:hypothetical protein